MNAENENLCYIGPMVLRNLVVVAVLNFFYNVKLHEDEDMAVYRYALSE
ncbi:MAG: hypothetical protein V3V49_13020 [Candidatus Krumholzibacteria bacterium]